ncbi:hypothetical protein P3T24_007424 [Paraburkholderia sp. GAS33]|jgi:hypothetical protein|uniref:Uncharacterized protein n=1 Tax=Paraburkholderia phenazinium TaxID=60549 RepID=A0A1N6HYW9_9BURK|nr:hypothetical protein SAMN05444168_3779 [Paraburkholderia phenazinium]
MQISPPCPRLCNDSNTSRPSLGLQKPDEADAVDAAAKSNQCFVDHNKYSQMEESL